MFRRVIAMLVMVSIAAFSYQPSLAMTLPAPPEATASAEAVSMPDCPGAVEEHDCCDQTDQQQQTCVWDAACAARCHVNAGIAPMMDAPLLVISPAGLVTMGDPQVLVPERPGPLFRPPIL